MARISLEVQFKGGVRHLIRAVRLNVALNSAVKQRYLHESFPKVAFLDFGPSTWYRVRT